MAAPHSWCAFNRHAYFIPQHGKPIELEKSICNPVKKLQMRIAKAFRLGKLQQSKSFAMAPNTLFLCKTHSNQTRHRKPRAEYPRDRTAHFGKLLATEDDKLRYISKKRGYQASPLKTHLYPEEE